MGSTLAIVDDAQEPRWKEGGTTTFFLPNHTWLARPKHVVRPLLSLAHTLSTRGHHGTWGVWLTGRWRKSRRVSRHCLRPKRRPLRSWSRLDLVRVLSLTPDRTQKLKEAQTEAEKDIAELKAKKEQELDEYKQKYEGTQSSAQDKIDRDTKDRLSEIERAFQDKREELISKLLDRVSQVDPQPHKNLQKMSA